MTSLRARLGRLRREVLGLNRRNHDFMIPFNPAPWVALVDNKLATKSALEPYGLALPRTFATCLRPVELRRFVRLLQPLAEFVLKPARGAGGEGILVVADRQDGVWRKTSGERLTERDLLAHAADVMAGAFSLGQSHDHVFAEQRLVTHEALQPFAFGGVPDIRVVVVFGVPLLAMVRLPTRQSDGRANLHLGGIGVGIDLASGQACHAVWQGKGITHHPDQRTDLRSLTVPHWDALLFTAARCFDAVPLGYFGVDIVVDRQLGPCILEINARPGLQIQLANRRGLRPLLDAVCQRRPTDSATAADRVALGVEIYRQVTRADGRAETPP